MHKLKKSKERRAPRMYLGLGLIAAPAVVSGAVLSSAYVFAGDSVVDVVSLVLSPSCGVTTTGTNSHIATVANGTYTSDIGTTTMKITCNDSAGFSVYAAGFTGNMVGQTNSNKLVGARSNVTIDTGTATSAGNPDVSNWAMKLAQDPSETYLVDILDNYDSYHAVPNNYTKVATRSSGTDVGQYSTGATITSTYAAYISRTQATDSYFGKVKYTLVHPNNALAPVSPSLYLQNTSDIANAVPNVGDTAVAVDLRDGKEYTVGKLADQRIWLLDNLALDLTSPSATVDITAANTNATAASLNALFHGVSGGGQGGNLARAAVSSSWDTSYTDPIIDTSYSDTTMSDITDTSGTYGGDWTIGNYYNYCAASAGSYCYEEYSSEGDALDDICPSGWRMPTGGGDGEYYNLYGYYGSGDDFRRALDTPFSGFHDSYSVEYLGTDGYFWSSTSSGNYSPAMYTLGMDNSSIMPTEEHYRERGLPVRCIMKND